jgi:hypothetical protein
MYNDYPTEKQQAKFNSFEKSKQAQIILMSLIYKL